METKKGGVKNFHAAFFILHIKPEKLLNFEPRLLNFRLSIFKTHIRVPPRETNLPMTNFGTLNP